MFSCQKYFSKKANQNNTKHISKLKRTSPSASEGGAITLEASLIVPLFLVVLLMMLSAGEILMIHGQIAHGLKEAACHTAVSEYAVSRNSKKVAGVLINSPKAEFLSHVNRRFMDQSCVIGGSLGVVIKKETEGNEEITLIANYAIRKKMPFLFPFFGQFTQKIRQKSMTGYVPRGDEIKEGIVYVTPNEGVYHTDLSCTHLSLSISVEDDVETYLAGKTSYKECEKCSKYYQGTVHCLYIPKEGDAYHTDIGCSGLKRTVSQVDRSSLKGVQPCQRCGK